MRRCSMGTPCEGKQDAVPEMVEAATRKLFGVDEILMQRLLVAALMAYTKGGKFV